MLKRINALIAVMAMSLAPAASYGLADAAAPTKIQIPFANGAGGSYVRAIPVASQIGIQNGAASYTDGFPPLNFTPVNAGGVPPFGADMNGIMRDISAHARWWAAGGPVYYDGTYQTAIGGYPKGAIVQSATVTGKLWFSSTENNVTNPDTGGAGWSPVMNTVYAPLTGTGASGTWGINITGNAATANSATSATNATFATTAGGANGQTFFTSGGGAVGSENDIGAAVNGFPSAYLYNNSNGWGLYSTAGGTILSYTRAGGLVQLTGNAATATNATNATNAVTAATCSDEIGVGQSWQNVLSSRSVATRYTNNTARPIMVIVTFSLPQNGTAMLSTANETINLGTTANTSAVASSATLSAIIPVGATYYVSVTNTAVPSLWVELR